MISSELSLNPIPNLDNKDSTNSAPISNQIKNEEDSSIPHENITISLKSEDEGTSIESNPESKGMKRNWYLIPKVIYYLKIKKIKKHSNK